MKINIKIHHKKCFNEIQKGQKNGTLLVQEGESGPMMTYHYKEGIVDPYNFFDEYRDTYAGRNFMEECNCMMGIG